MPKPMCDVHLSITVPLSVPGFADGICCQRPAGHKSRLHEATHRGRITVPGESYVAPATANIKWSANDAAK